MIRAAKFGDILRLAELMREMYERSIYVDDCEFEEKETKALVMRCIQRHGGRRDGSTFVFVADRAGVAEGFIIAALSRLYGVCANLAAGNTPDPADSLLTLPVIEDTLLTPEDTERLLLGVGVTRGQINAAKCNRGKPMPF